MDFEKLAQDRYSVRKFSDRPVEQEKIDKLLTVCRLAPTAANRQPQRILVLNEPQALSGLKDCTPYHFDAPLAFLICYDTEKVWVRKQDSHNSGDVDASIVGTHLMMAAVELGLGSTWVMAFDPAAIRDAYRIPPQLVPVALFPVGYPADDAKPSHLHSDRLSLDETVFYNGF